MEIKERLNKMDDQIKAIGRNLSKVLTDVLFNSDKWMLWPRAGRVYVVPTTYKPRTPYWGFTYTDDTQEDVIISDEDMDAVKTRDFDCAVFKTIDVPRLGIEWTDCHMHIVTSGYWVQIGLTNNLHPELSEYGRTDNDAYENQQEWLAGDGSVTFVCHLLVDKNWKIEEIHEIMVHRHGKQPKGLAPVKGQILKNFVEMRTTTNRVREMDKNMFIKDIDWEVYEKSYKWCVEDAIRNFDWNTTWKMEQILGGIEKRVKFESPDDLRRCVRDIMYRAITRIKPEYKIRGSHEIIIDTRFGINLYIDLKNNKGCNRGWTMNIDYAPIYSRSHGRMYEEFAEHSEEAGKHVDFAGNNKTGFDKALGFVEDYSAPTINESFDPDFVKNKAVMSFRSNQDYLSWE